MTADSIQEKLPKVDAAQFSNHAELVENPAKSTDRDKIPYESY